MSIQCSGDPIRGFVTLNASNLKEEIDNLLHQLAPIEVYPQAEQRWQISGKIDKAIRLLRSSISSTEMPYSRILNSADTSSSGEMRLCMGASTGASITGLDVLRSGRAPAFLIDPLTRRSLTTRFRMLNRPCFVR